MLPRNIKTMRHLIKRQTDHASTESVQVLTQCSMEVFVEFYNDAVWRRHLYVSLATSRHLRCVISNSSMCAILNPQKMGRFWGSFWLVEIWNGAFWLVVRLLAPGGATVYYPIIAQMGRFWGSFWLVESSSTTRGRYRSIVSTVLIGQKLHPLVVKPSPGGATVTSPFCSYTVGDRSMEAAILFCFTFCSYTVGDHSMKAAILFCCHVVLRWYDYQTALQGKVEGQRSPTFCTYTIVS